MTCLDIANKLHQLPGFFWLDSAGGLPKQARFSYLGALPNATLSFSQNNAQLWKQDVGTSTQHSDPFEALTQFWSESQERLAHVAQTMPCCVGYLSYDLASYVESIKLPESTTLPLLQFGSYDAVYVFDHQRHEGHWVGTKEGITRRQEALSQATTVLGSAQISTPVLDVSREAYGEMLRAAKEYIRAGDIYQANLSLGLSAAFSGDPFALYLRLREVAKTPFAAYLSLSQGAILSASMERFLRGHQTPAGLWVETNPIKGTRPRGKTPREDAMQRSALLASEKDRAEHVMIVDLERNDLGRLALPPTVRVSELCALYEYETVLHLVSTIEALLPKDTSLAALLRATFPTGSITGAPKRRAMECIAALEKKARGIYCGSIGYLDTQGGFDFSVAIRTAALYDKQLQYRAGGGIVIDSDEESEWQECFWKAQAFLRAITT